MSSVPSSGSNPGTAGVSALFHQPVLSVSEPESFATVRAAVENAFSSARVRDFLRSLERGSLRIRDFEAVMGKGLLGSPTEAAYAKLSPGDQGQIRELYLASLEQVSPELRAKFLKLYAYY